MSVQNRSYQRQAGRLSNQLRSISIEPNYLRHPAGSALVRFGETWVVCTASVEERVPPFLLGTNQGWVTAEYNMIPGSGTNRVSRSPSGRGKEIERLIGRSLRAAVDRSRLGTRTFTIDCDVIQADGGTRTAAITGGFVALVLAIEQCVRKRILQKNPLTKMVAAVSVGMMKGETLLDLDYSEDSQADVDMNVVMAKQGEEANFIEVQGTAEKQAFDRNQLLVLSDLAALGITQLFQYQKQVLADVSLLQNL